MAARRAVQLAHHCRVSGKYFYRIFDSKKVIKLLFIFAAILLRTAILKRTRFRNRVHVERSVRVEEKFSLLHARLCSLFET